MPEVLVRSDGKRVTRKQLLRQVWSEQHTTETQYLRVCPAQLRRKLEPTPSRPLLAEPGTGYRFAPRRRHRAGHRAVMRF